MYPRRRPKIKNREFYEVVAPFMSRAKYLGYGQINIQKAAYMSRQHYMENGGSRKSLFWTALFKVTGKSFENMDHVEFCNETGLAETTLRKWLKVIR